MVQLHGLRLLPLGVLTIILLTSCGEAPVNAAEAVESYYQAMVEKDLNGMINASCADWEEQANLEYNSFSAVDLTLEDLACQEEGEDNDFRLVSCSGTLVANYGAEVLNIDIAGRIFRVKNEEGEWRMCGYQ